MGRWRSERGATDQDALQLRASDKPQDPTDTLGLIPEANRPGHHPDDEQDKPTSPRSSTS